MHCRIAELLNEILKLHQTRQPPNRRRLLFLFDVGIDVHRKTNITVTSKRLGRLRRDVRAGEVGDERMPQAVEIGKAAL